MNNFKDIPFEKITLLGQRTMLERKLFTVSWILGRFCNYDCSYCWPYAKSKKPDHQTLEIYCNSIDKIKQQARSNGFTEFHFSFSGGEPTAYKKFDSIIKHLVNDSIVEYQSLHLTTNLSPHKKWWKQFISLSEKLSRRSITASFHAEFADENEFGDKCLFLMENGIFVTVNQVMVPSQFDKYYSRCERLSNRGINVTLKPQSDPTASYVIDSYSDAQLEVMQTGFPQIIPNADKNLIPLLQVELTDENGDNYYIDQAERFNAFNFNRFKGWTCNAGYQGIVIRENEVKRSYSCSDESIGTLDGGFEIFNAPKKCITETCVSSADSKIPKVKNV